MSNQLMPLLLAEDDDLDAELTISAFENRNLANRIVRVKDGVEAMEYLKYEGKYADREKINPALILMDLKMPRMTGIEVIKAIKSDPKLGLIPVVALTSSREAPDVRQCYELGVNAYVVKPVDFDEFVDAVGELGIFWAVFNEPPH
ncbi:MAG: response regulator [Gammaproteobacteria bacterium]|nr:response regulator [Gammaproteobacteria bacterium]